MAADKEAPPPPQSGDDSPRQLTAGQLATGKSLVALARVPGLPGAQRADSALASLQASDLRLRRLLGGGQKCYRVGPVVAYKCA